MREIGGYIEFERYNRPMLHGDAIALNSGRNCLAYLIRARKIKKIKLPYFLCDSVQNLCKAERVKVSFYRINEYFQPENIFLEEDEWLYLVNFYGQLSQNYIRALKDEYCRVIVDNAQAYFQMPIEEVDTLYTCRKYFGVADGAFLYSDAIFDEELEIDVSYNRMRFLLGRFEKPASEFYADYVSNNRSFASEPLKYMSKLTKNLLQGIDYMYVKDQRVNNFALLHEKLGSFNKLEIRQDEGTFMYPFYHENAVYIRKKLQQDKIYIPTLWTNVLENVAESDLEYSYALNILPLPCDQRYNIEDLEYMVDMLRKYM